MSSTSTAADTGWRRRVQLVWRELTPVRQQLRRDVISCAAGSCVLLVLLLVGSVLFSCLESTLEQPTKCGVRRHQRLFLDELWAKSDQLEKRGWRTLAVKRLAEHEQKLAEAFAEGVTSYSGHKLWTYSNGLVYAWTVVTTLGYGHLSPVTSAGRAASMIYAIIGIPIFLAVLADYGKLFTRALKLMMAAVYRLYHAASAITLRRQTVNAARSDHNDDVPGTEASDDQIQEEAVLVVDDEFNLPISLALAILMIYLFLGATMFALTEKWSYFDAFYFVFISMTTIGFGDFVPSSAGVMMCTTLYMIFGLALTSMCINVIQEKLTLHLRHASLKLGSRLGVEMATTPLPTATLQVTQEHGKTS